MKIAITYVPFNGMVTTLAVLDTKQPGYDPATALCESMDMHLPFQPGDSIKIRELVELKEIC